MKMKMIKCSWSFLQATKSFNRQTIRRYGASTSRDIEDQEKLTNFMEGRTVPESRGPPILGMLSWVISSAGGAKLHEYVDQKHKELGPIYRDCVGPVRAIFINIPDEYRRIFRLEGPTPKHYLPEVFHLYNQMRNCRRGLLFMDGEEWLRFRRILNKILFTPDPIYTLGQSCQIVAEDFAKRWSLFAKNNMIVPHLEDQLYQWSIEVILAVLIGPDVWNQNKQRMEQQAEKLSKVLYNTFFYTAKLSSLPPTLAMKLNVPWWKKFVKSIDDAMDILRTLIPELSQLNGNGILRSMLMEGICEEDLFRIVADLIIAAGDTTAYSMQWTLFLLASHPEKQRQLYEKIKNLNQEDTLRDQFLKGVIKEALRLYPIAPFITRFLPEDNTIAGYKILKEELLLMSLYSSGRDAANFVKPNEFQPERWLRTEKGDYQGVIVPHATLPFAMGARSCIGKKLAETQLALTIAELIKKYTMDCTNKERIQLKLKMISVPSEPIHITLSKR